MASFTHHPNASTASVASRILSHTVNEESMHNGRKSTTTIDRVTKGVVKALDPNRGQCLVTRESEAKAPLDHAHLFPRCENNNDDLMTRLEHAFGIKHGLLNIDDAMNILLLKPDWHRLFDAKRWLLLPTLEMMKLLYKHDAGQDITKIYKAAKEFHYRLVPIGPGELMNLYRMKRPEDAVQGLEFERFKYPFKDLPALESHVHPHWVVLNAGMKLERISSPDMIVFTKRVADAYKISRRNAKNFIEQVILLNDRWRKTEVPESFTRQEVAQKVPSPRAAGGISGEGEDRVAQKVPSLRAAGGISGEGEDRVTQKVPSPRVAGGISGEGEDRGSEKSSTGNRFIKTTMAAIGFMKKRPSSSPTASFFQLSGRESKRSKVGSIHSDNMQEA